LDPAYLRILEPQGICLLAQINEILLHEVRVPVYLSELVVMQVVVLHIPCLPTVLVALLMVLIAQLMVLVVLMAVNGC
jgi:hypothetical protein